jgi:uncharacterized protein YjbI with pentapeptide repeats
MIFCSFVISTLLLLIEFNQSVRLSLVYFILTAIVSTLGSLILNSGGLSRDWLASWLQNFSTEVLGAFVTYILFEVLIGGRLQQEHHERQLLDLRNQIVRDITSSNSTFALRSIREARDNKMLFDGTMANLRLDDANLSSGDLRGANLERTILQRADLSFSHLEQANLCGCNLTSAKLTGAHLKEARLVDAELWSADLSNADLTGADLSGTYLCRANLVGANLTKVKFSTRTVLPDAEDIGEFLEPVYDRYWTTEIDMRRYTDPDHPEFWKAPKCWIREVN